MKMFRILVKIDDKCYNCKVRTKNQLIQGIGKMAEATRRGVIPNQMADIVKES